VMVCTKTAPQFDALIAFCRSATRTKNRFCRDWHELPAARDVSCGVEGLGRAFANRQAFTGGPRLCTLVKGRIQEPNLSIFALSRIWRPSHDSPAWAEGLEVRHS